MKKKAWAGVVLLIALAAGGYFYYKSRTPKEFWKTTILKKGDLDVSILATGTVQPENRLEIKSPIAGRIEKILVDEGDKVRKGQILAWISSTERAAMLDAARSQGQQEVKRWEEMYKPTPIIAPISGTIILRNVEAGQTFTTTDAVLVMSDRLTVKAQVDETDLAQIQLKQKAEIRLDAYPDQKISAQVDQIAFEAKTVNNVTTYLVTVLPVEAPPTMRSGMTANVTFFVNSKKDVLLIPVEFVKYDNGKSVVLAKAEEGPPVEKEVRLGTSDGKNSEVLSGVEEGEAIVMLVPKGKGPKSTSPFSPMGGARPRGGSGGR
jgi:macrolide-specific efflux system membrane fusion protein